MLPIAVIVAVVLAYVLISIVLISLNLPSRWRWWIKGGAIVVTTFFFAGTYFAVSEMLGWPLFTRSTGQFSLLQAKIVDPDEATSRRGQIFLWVDKLDANNIPLMRPVAYEVPYSDALADQLRQAQEKVDNGEGVMGEIETEAGEGDGPEQEANEQNERNLQLQQNQNQGEAQAVADTQPFLELDPLMFAFTELPPPVLPDKGPQ